MRIKREDVLVFIIVVFMVSNISALFEYYCQTLFGEFFKYIISLFVILIFGLELLYVSRRNHSRTRTYNYIKLQTIFLVLYGSLYFINHQLLSDNSSQPFHISSYTVLAIQYIAVLLIGDYIVLKASKSALKKIVFTYLVLVVIDCLFSLYYLSINDQALRISSWQTGERVLTITGLHGVCNALHIYSFITLIPVILLLSKTLKKRFFAVLLLALLIITVLRAGYTMAMIITFVYCCLAIVFSITNNEAIKVISSIVVILIVFFVNWSYVFLYLASNISNSSVSERFNDLYRLVYSGQTGGALTVRINVYTRGWKGFLNSPIWGNVLSGNRMISQHSTIIDILSDWGVIGFLLYGGFLYYLKKTIDSISNENTSRWINHSFILYLITITINTLGRYANGTLVIAVILPAVVLLYRIHQYEEKLTPIN